MSEACGALGPDREHTHTHHDQQGTLQSPHRAQRGAELGRGCRRACPSHERDPPRLPRLPQPKGPAACPPPSPVPKHRPAVRLCDAVPRPAHSGAMAAGVPRPAAPPGTGHYGPEERPPGQTSRCLWAADPSEGDCLSVVLAHILNYDLWDTCDSRFTDE